MAASSGNTDVFDCQVKACEEFFQEKLPKVQNLKPLENDCIPENAKKFKGPIYDITNLGRFPFVRTDRPDPSRSNENFTFDQNYPTRSVKS